MAKSAFGNPLSTGIALNFKVDMTPYQQIHARKMKRLEDENKEKKRKKKELAGILSKVTLDEDKIFWRQHDNAKIQYADTIDKITTMYNNEDYSGMYKTMNDFGMDMSNLMQENAVIKARASEITKGGKYYDPALEAMQNDRDVSNADYATALEEAGYGDISEKGIYNYTPLQGIVNVDELWQKGLKGIEKTVFDKTGQKTVKGRQDQTRFLETEIPEDVYLAKKEQIKQSIKSTPQRAIAFLRANGKDVKSLAGMSQADQTAQTDLWLEEIIGGAGEKYRKGEDTVGIATQKKSTGFTFGGGGAKSPNWEINPISNIPVALTDEQGGKYSGYKIDYIKQTGQTELTRNIELGKGAYFAEGGSKIHEISDKATGMGKVIPATPAGIYIRNDKPGEPIWAAYETKYMPVKVEDKGEFKNLYYDSSSTLTLDEQFAQFKALGDDEKDALSKTSRIVYVPLRTENEEIEFRTTLGMSSKDFETLLDNVKGSNVMTQAEFNAAWAKLKPGEKLTSPDGKEIYTK